MDIYFSPYTLTPLKRINRLSSLEPKHGVFLKAVVDGQSVFADYFPHAPFGDKNCEQFLAEFKHQREEYEQKILHLLRRDLEYQRQGAVPFRNHQLWNGSEAVEASVVKYKILHAFDVAFHDLLRKKKRLRLDCNGMFDRPGFISFVESIPPELRPLIDYVEDPLGSPDWSGLPLPAARDFVSGSPYGFYITKPNCEFYPKETRPVIVSSYLGSALGNWHTYCEMVELADLSQIHGVVTLEYYQGERKLFLGSYAGTFVPDLNAVKNLYQELHLRSWKHLCSI